MAETTRYYGTGKRKNAIAKVWLSNGQGNITVNNRTARATTLAAPRSKP